MAKMRFNMDLGEIEKRTHALPDKVDRVIKAIVDRNAIEGTAYMKENAPWTDRTTAARNGLHTVPAHYADRHEITFSHTVPYGIWLEIANSGKYEIIMPSVVHQGRNIMRNLERTLGKI